MSQNSVGKERKSIAVWLQAGRAWSFPASMVSVFIAGALALSYEGDKNWWLFPIVVLCAFLYHAGANMHSDYFDYKREVDKDYTFGGSGVLTRGMLTPRELYIGAWVVLGAASALGLVLVYFHGWPMLALGAFGLLGGYFYCASPVGYKYYALGDLAVFLFFGTLMVAGAFFALTGNLFYWPAYIISIPAGLLIAGILSANNIRDIKHDTEAGVKTLESTVGLKAGVGIYAFYIIGAYVSVVAMALLQIVPVWSLIVFLSLPLAIKSLKTVAQSDVNAPEKIAMADVMTAQLHTAFGLLFTISLAVKVFFSSGIQG